MAAVGVYESLAKYDTATVTELLVMGKRLDHLKQSFGLPSVRMKAVLGEAWEDVQSYVDIREHFERNSLSALWERLVRHYLMESEDWGSMPEPYKVLGHMPAHFVTPGSDVPVVMVRRVISKCIWADERFSRVLDGFHETWQNHVMDAEEVALMKALLGTYLYVVLRAPSSGGRCEDAFQPLTRLTFVEQVDDLLEWDQLGYGLYVDRRAERRLDAKPDRSLLSAPLVQDDLFRRDLLPDASDIELYDRISEVVLRRYRDRRQKRRSHHHQHQQKKKHSSKSVVLETADPTK